MIKVEDGINEPHKTLEKRIEKSEKQERIADRQTQQSNQESDLADDQEQE